MKTFRTVENATLHKRAFYVPDSQLFVSWR